MKDVARADDIVKRSGTYDMRAKDSVDAFSGGRKSNNNMKKVRNEMAVAILLQDSA